MGPVHSSWAHIAAENWFIEQGFWELVAVLLLEDSKTQSSPNFLHSRPQEPYTTIEDEISAYWTPKYRDGITL